MSEPPLTAAQVASLKVVHGQPAALTVKETDDDVFVPKNVTIQAGQIVAWVNDGDHVHDVTFGNHQLASGDMANGDTFQLEFTKPGKFNYVCIHHVNLGMDGSVTVT